MLGVSGEESVSYKGRTAGSSGGAKSVRCFFFLYNNWLTQINSAENKVINWFANGRPSPDIPELEHRALSTGKVSAVRRNGDGFASGRVSPEIFTGSQ